LNFSLFQFNRQAVSIKMSTCDKCRKVLANRHSLSRHKKTCPVRLSEEGTSLHTSGDSTYSHPAAGSNQYNEKLAENVINGDISSKNEESEPLVKVIKLSGDASPPAFSSHSTSYDNQNDDDEDRPLTESELEELNKNFRSLHFDLINNGCRENIPELLQMLGVLLEANKLSQPDYEKATDVIKQYEVKDHDEDGDDDRGDDHPLTEMEKDKFWARFKTLHHELINKRLRENIMELNKILHILLEEKMVDHIGYMKAINTINKDYLATYL